MLQAWGVEGWGLGLAAMAMSYRRPQKYYVDKIRFANDFPCQVAITITQRIIEIVHFACASVSHGTKASNTITYMTVSE